MYFSNCIYSYNNTTNRFEPNETWNEIFGEQTWVKRLIETPNGDIWYGQEALNNHLVDQVMTSDEYLMQLAEEADVFEVSFETKKTLQEKLGMAASMGITRSIDRVITKFLDARTQIR